MHAATPSKHLTNLQVLEKRLKAPALAQGANTMRIDRNEIPGDRLLNRSQFSAWQKARDHGGIAKARGLGRDGSGCSSDGRAKTFWHRLAG